MVLVFPKAEKREILNDIDISDDLKRFTSSSWMQLDAPSMTSNFVGERQADSWPGHGANLSRAASELRSLAAMDWGTWRKIHKLQRNGSE